MKDTVELRHYCRATHIRSETVIEKSGGIVWEGVVEVFALTGHYDARWCYAWLNRVGGGARYVTVLQVLPVISAQTAVRAAIANGQL